MISTSLPWFFAFFFLYWKLQFDLFHGMNTQCSVFVREKWLKYYYYRFRKVKWLIGFFLILFYFSTNINNTKRLLLFMRLFITAKKKWRRNIKKWKHKRNENTFNYSTIYKILKRLYFAALRIYLIYEKAREWESER